VHEAAHEIEGLHKEDGAELPAPHQVERDIGATKGSGYGSLRVPLSYFCP
jgi:hypothetical protein